MDKQIIPIDEEAFYNNIISWKNLIIKGYFDFQEFNNQNIDTEDNDYGKTDVIYPNYFNLKAINKLNAWETLKRKNYSICNTTPILFTIPKSQNVRRPLKFPNLYSYCLLAKIIVDNKDEIIKGLISDTESTSRYFGYSPYSFSVTKSIQDKLLIGHTHYFKTDFSNFYHSFYTHAIAWILMGKEKAKKFRHDSDSTANLLDHAIRAEQNGETHGLPTGNLITRIIVEYFMSYIDRELRESFKETGITFNRYVDDITFGYDVPEELSLIKRVLQKITQKYDISINDEKTEDTTFVEIKKGPHLIGYFDNLLEKIKLDTVTKISKKQISKLEFDFLSNYNSYNIKKSYDNFYDVLNREQLSNTKGAEKLSLRVLMFFINSINYEKNIEIKSQQPLYKALHALIEKENKVNLDSQASFIERILQLALSDSKLMLPFIQLLDKIQEKENKLHDNFVTDYLKHFIENLGMGLNIDKENFFSERLYFYLENEMNQEAYSILLLFDKLNISLSSKMNNKIQKLIVKKQIEVDDFTLLFLVHSFILQSNMSQLDKNNFFDMIEGLLVVDDFIHDAFTGKHWLLRYEILYRSITNDNFKKDIKQYYVDHKDIKIHNMDFDYFKEQIYKVKDKSNKSNKNNNSNKVNEFFIELLNKKVSFTNFEYK
ncbi:RNA-directed DNA polymerase [Lactobacillus sp. PSON]|uniref:RNA-directed DNA polymerase n=1 Tax=Lactobacillus sp. PSON TaxID=3455454 RepID=UPI004041E017